jgi:hypothetical protein
MLACDFFRADILHRRARPELAEPAETNHRRPGQILGRAPYAPGPLAPLDGRLVDLGPHSCVELAMGSHVLIAIAGAHTPT